LLGGFCDSPERPVVFFSHGYGADDPTAYLPLIRHWTSIGNVVVYSYYDSTPATDLPTTFRQADASGAVAASVEPRMDLSRVGFFGHSHGSGMTPFLVQQAAARGWGTWGLWMASFEQAYTQLQGTGGPIQVPARTRALVISGDSDQYTDARLGIDVFNSLTLPFWRKAHVTLRSDARGTPAVTAGHLDIADGVVNQFDYTVYRLADILQTCSVRWTNCLADLRYAGRWSDGVPVARSVVSQHPVDVGPAPAILAECDGVYKDLNPRVGECHKYAER
jgi:hypothetical protein